MVYLRWTFSSCCTKPLREGFQTGLAYSKDRVDVNREQEGPKRRVAIEKCKFEQVGESGGLLDNIFDVWFEHEIGVNQNTQVAFTLGGRENVALKAVLERGIFFSSYDQGHALLQVQFHLPVLGP